MGDKITTLKTELVEYMPEKKEPGVIYVSHRFELAIHLCACGECNQETVTDFGSWKQSWTLTLDAENRASLHPSIGNFQFSCRSHYWVKNGEVIWC